MAQLLKPEVQERIVEAAGEAFARQGFEGASMAEIARKAGISTGNIYRYFKSKDDLFQAVLPETLVTRFMELIRRRVEALTGVDDIRSLSPGARYHFWSEELFAFCLEHRWPVVLLLADPAHASVLETLVDALGTRAVDHFRSLAEGRPVYEPSPSVLQALYRNFLRTMRDTLSLQADSEVIRRAVDDYATYHLGGLRELFLGGPLGAKGRHGQRQPGAR